MIKVSVFTSRGDWARHIALDLPKGRISTLILKAVDEGRDGFSTVDLERLDSGRLSLTRLALLVSPDEIRAGLDRAITKSFEAAEVAADVSCLLTEYVLAGGDSAAGSGAPKDLQKSPPVPMHETAERHGWEPSRTVSGGTKYIHPRHENHELTLHARGTWLHHGPDCSEAGSAAELEPHLAKFHKEHEQPNALIGGKKFPAKSQAGADIVKAANDAWKRSSRP